MYANGYQRIPVCNWDAIGKGAGKRPSIDDWTQFVGVPGWNPAAANTGILTSGLRAIDVDVDDAVKADGIRRLILEHLGPGPIRFRSNSRRFLIPYRAMHGAPKKRTVELGNMPKGEKVEILGDGQQFVTHGIHDTGVPIEWLTASPCDIPRDELIAIRGIGQGPAHPGRRRGQI
jgi:hypothetical protein